MIKYQSFMKVSDEDTELKIWNYTGDLKDDGNKYRGCITDKSNEVICPSLGYTYEYYIDTKEESMDRFKRLSDWQWFYSTEGTMLRLFYYKEQWRITTHKKLSAFDSRWSCNQSFGELFVQCLEKLYPNRTEDVYKWFLNQLDKDRIYYFMLRSNSQNRVICHTSSIEEKDHLIFIGYRNVQEMNFILGTNENTPELRGVQKSLKIGENFETVDDLFQFVENQIDPFQYQGIIGFSLVDGNYEITKIINSRYKELAKIRGNNHNLKFRYLEIRNDPQKVEKLFMLYPKQVSTFDEYEKVLIKIVKRISKTYVDRFINCKYITLPKEEYIVLRKCNEWCRHHKETFISQNQIMAIINMESPLNVYKMIQRYRNDEMQQRFYQNRIKKTNTFDNIVSFYNFERKISNHSLDQITDSSDSTQ